MDESARISIEEQLFEMGLMAVSYEESHEDRCAIHSGEECDCFMCIDVLAVPINDLSVV